MVPFRCRQIILSPILFPLEFSKMPLVAGACHGQYPREVVPVLMEVIVGTRFDHQRVEFCPSF